MSQQRKKLKCCGAGCWYVATRCEGDESGPEIVYVPCGVAVTLEFWPSTNVFSFGGSCYEVSASSLQSPSSFGGDVVIPARVFEDCETCGGDVGLLCSEINPADCPTNIALDWDVESYCENPATGSWVNNHAIGSAALIRSPTSTTYTYQSGTGSGTVLTTNSAGQSILTECIWGFGSPGPGEVSCGVSVFCSLTLGGWIAQYGVSGGAAVWCGLRASTGLCGVIGGYPAFSYGPAFTNCGSFGLPTCNPATFSVTGSLTVS